jgi:Uma2 family endonuclease
MITSKQKNESSQIPKESNGAAMNDVADNVDPFAVRHPIVPGEPTWDIARLFPAQGQWTEAEYLALETNQLIELTDGSLDFLPMPTLFHQLIVRYLFDLLRLFAQTHKAGDVFFAPLRIRLWSGKIREPDIVLLTAARIIGLREPPRGADLAIEVVSDFPEDRNRDLITKREEYARAGIGEYWIVDPELGTITVLVLEGDQYRLHGEFAVGVRASSVVLPGFEVDVASVFAAGEGPVV